MKNFGLIGVAGFVAPRHLNAIKKTNNSLIAVLDKFDSVGIIDSYFPNADFFVEFERFDRHLEKLKYEDNLELDYVSVCTPNYLHDAHVRFALRRGADAICEKPLVLNPWNIDKLVHIEKESGKRIWNILQSRLHPSLISLKERIKKGPSNKIYDIDLTYLTSRGSWYFTSWKGDISKSGGIATNIGIHFFDILTWIFGEVKQNTVHIHSHDRAAGFLELEHARVRWFLSVNFEDFPDNIKVNGQRTHRSLVIEGEELEFSRGFTDLHTKSYEEILSGNGCGIEETRQAIEIVHDIRATTPVGLKGDYHPLARNNN
jgi:UDP-N-acetyl-2-amino-2-deoxyglucuronate dehydrogenase